MFRIFFKVDFANIGGIFFKKVHPHIIENAHTKNRSSAFFSFRVYLADLKFYDFDIIGNLYIIGFNYVNEKNQNDHANGFQVVFPP